MRLLLIGGPSEGEMHEDLGHTLKVLVRTAAIWRPADCMDPIGPPLSVEYYTKRKLAFKDLRREYIKELYVWEKMPMDAAMERLKAFLVEQFIMHPGG